MRKLRTHHTSPERSCVSCPPNAYCSNDTFNLVVGGSIGFGAYGIITSFSAVLDSGRYMQDIWGGGRLAATQVAGWCMMFMATVPWIIFKGKEIKSLNRAILYIMMILSVVSSAG